MSEYELLRNELLMWQSRRFTLLSVSAAFIVAIIGFGSSGSLGIPPYLIVTLGLVFLSVTCYLTAYCGRSNQIIGSYLEVFYEQNKEHYQWERSIERFNEELDSNKLQKNGKLNSLLFLIYGALAFVTIMIPISTKNVSEISVFYLLPPLISLFLFVYSWTELYISQEGRKEYKTIWQEVKRAQGNKAKTWAKHSKRTRNIASAIRKIL